MKLPSPASNRDERPTQAARGLFIANLAKQLNFPACPWLNSWKRIGNFEVAPSLLDIQSAAAKALSQFIVRHGPQKIVLPRQPRAVNRMLPSVFTMCWCHWNISDYSREPRGKNRFLSA